MKEILTILTIGYHKGEIDFDINSDIRDLSREQMKDFREMVVVAIGIAEQMWRESNSPNRKKSKKARN